MASQSLGTIDSDSAFPISAFEPVLSYYQLGPWQNFSEIWVKKPVNFFANIRPFRYQATSTAGQQHRHIYERGVVYGPFVYMCDFKLQIVELQVWRFSRADPGFEVRGGAKSIGKFENRWVLYQYIYNTISFYSRLYLKNDIYAFW